MSRGVLYHVHVFIADITDMQRGDAITFIEAASIFIKSPFFCQIDRQALAV
jgi:hypothetical protein